MNQCDGARALWSRMKHACSCTFSMYIGASFVHNYIVYRMRDPFFFILYFSTNRARLKEFSSQIYIHIYIYSLQSVCLIFLSWIIFHLYIRFKGNDIWSQSTSHEKLFFSMTLNDIFLSLFFSFLFFSFLFFFSTMLCECQDIYLSAWQREERFIFFTKIIRFFPWSRWS